VGEDLWWKDSWKRYVLSFEWKRVGVGVSDDDDDNNDDGW